MAEGEEENRHIKEGRRRPWQEEREAKTEKRSCNEFLSHE